ncbi:cyclic nucleotide-gated cation channel alpha-3-like [Acanthaster planci]|uniref:Cyclic nucleotide-gated cation channel alpha-3-like n=1 Tax=Acanthaster planci TaxID=133434 RepID=A0A8B7Z8X5_ACAPL|nr:cyclic nucleotide-gated cation channel alpha-3-like [Acanthaster planci]
MSGQGHLASKPIGSMVDIECPSHVGQDKTEKRAIVPANNGNLKSKHERNQVQEVQEISTNSSDPQGNVDVVEQLKSESQDKVIASSAGKRFRNSKVHPMETLSVTDSRATGLSDDEDSNGLSTVDLSASKRRSSSLWTSLRAAVNFNSAFLAKRRVKNTTRRVDSFLEKFTTRGRETIGYDDPESGTKNGEESEIEEPKTYILDPDGNFIFYWLLVIAIAFEYNVWFLIAREAWPGLQEQGGAAWFVLDYLFDFIYLLDICVQLRTGFLDHGILVNDGKCIARHYMRSRSCALDLIALTPLDFLYIINPSRLHTIVRFPRLLKAYRLVTWYYMAEAKATLPAVFRIANICHILLLLVHWLAALYFLFCERIGFGSGEWVYPDPEGEFNSTARMYLMSFYWSTQTLTLIGDVPMPSSEWEYVFQIISYLIGVIVFATVVGQVGIVVENRNSLRLEFERHVDNAKKYMSTYKVAKDVQNRVLLWYFYSWKRSKTDVNSLGPLPTKLRTELAIHVHLKTLRKVNIFRECPPEFLHDLVLKMHTCIHTPGDLVCRRGEVAREMFIISDGLLEVVRSDGEVLTTLQPGEFFGEIGILNLGGTANRRTADVRSVGYSELFKLSKGDVLDALRDFPQAQEKLEEEARRRLSINRKSPLLKARAVRGWDPSCTEASDAERLVSKATEGREQDRLFAARHNPVSSPEASPSLPRGDATRDENSFRPLLSSRAWKPKPPVPLKPSRRKRGSKGSVNSKGNEDEAWLADVMSTIREMLEERLDQCNKENQQLIHRIRKLEEELKTKEIENDQKDIEIKKLKEKLGILEDILKTGVKEC